MKNLNRLAPALDGNEYWMTEDSDSQATDCYETVRQPESIKERIKGEKK